MIEFNIFITSNDDLLEVPVLLDLDKKFSYMRKDVISVLGYYPPVYAWLDESTEIKNLSYFLLAPDGKIVHEKLIEDGFIIVHDLSVPIKLGRSSKLLQLFDIDNENKMLVPKDKNRIPSSGIPFAETSLRKCKARKIKNKSRCEDSMFLVDFKKEINENMRKRFSMVQWSFIHDMFQQSEDCIPSWRSDIFCENSDFCDCSMRLLEWTDTLGNNKD